MKRGVWGGERRRGAGTGNQGRLRHSLSICDSEKLSCRGEGLVVILSPPRRKEQETGAFALAEAFRLVFRKVAVC